MNTETCNIKPGDKILIRDTPKHPWQERVFIRLENGEAICKNPWRPEKEISWKYFKLGE